MAKPTTVLDPGHRALVVEDDPPEAELLCRLVRSNGDSPRLAGTVADALTAIAEETFCYFIVDRQLPTSADDMMPILGGGERVMAAIRKKDWRLNARKCHITPIIVVTGYTAHEDFVSKMWLSSTFDGRSPVVAFASRGLIRA